MADWSQLPYDLKALVVSRLDTIEDFVSVSSVCKSWRAVCSDMNRISGRTPWLMVGDNNDAPFRQCFSMTTFKFLFFPERDAHECRYWGSCLGWVVTVDKDEMYLLNPITRARIELPSQSALRSRLCSRHTIFNVVHLAYVFEVRESLVVLVIFGTRYDLAFIRAREDDEWSIVQSPTPGPATFCDVMCFEGWVLAMSMVGRIYFVDINSPVPPPPVQSIAVFLPDEKYQRLYLPESSGRLLMVVNYDKRREIFRVFRFDFNQNEWKQTEDVGDIALLVDEHHCASVAAHGFFQRNHVYYAKDNLVILMKEMQAQLGNLIYVYDLKEKRGVVHNVVGYFNSKYSCPTWFVPALR